jgi:hypothetical protein
VEAQEETSAAQAMSKTRDVEAAEVRIWKKAVESRRSIEMAWQSVKEESERKLVKKDGQEVVVKLLERLVSKAVGKVDPDEDDVDRGSIWLCVCCNSS